MIYFIQNTNTNLIKIGYSALPRKRLKQLQLSHIDKLKILLTIKGSYSEEGKVHKKFAHLRVNGEWFRPEKELVDFITNSITSRKKMGKSHFYLPSSAEQTLKNLGLRLKMARKRRSWTIVELANKMGVSSPTVIAIEKGKSQVSIGVLFSAMWVLGLTDMISIISNPEDKVGHALMDSRLPKRIRHSKKIDNKF